MGDMPGTMPVLPEGVSLEKGVNGLPFIRMSHHSGCRTEIYLYGAHITSWVDRSGKDKFFVSEKAWFGNGKPIRGGIPVIFPQFGPGELPQHGLARLKTWRLTHAEKMTLGALRATFQLSADTETLAAWPHWFRLEMVVQLDEGLTVSMRVRNMDRKEFAFAAAFHTYFRVEDIRRTAIMGLRDVPYIDALKNRARAVETRDVIRFDRETDRVYMRAAAPVCIYDELLGSTIQVEKTNLPDVVVWNPWIEKSRRMADFGEEEYLRMVCVETGRIANPITLEAGEDWDCMTKFTSKR